MASEPSPGSQGLASLPRKGGGLDEQPSPLAGEGRALARGEGAAHPRTDVANSALNFAKKLRREMTDAEAKLWQELRARRFENYKFKRQQPIGKYIADFVCLEHRLIIEVDGGQHDDSQQDIVRDSWLKSQNFRILRFWNNGVLTNMDGVLVSILAALKETK
jgi:very-short-patch-repair endonuclease